MLPSANIAQRFIVSYRQAPVASTQSQHHQSQQYYRADA